MTRKFAAFDTHMRHVIHIGPKKSEKTKQFQENSVLGAYRVMALLRGPAMEHLNGFISISGTLLCSRGLGRSSC